MTDGTPLWKLVFPETEFPLEVFSKTCTKCGNKFETVEHFEECDDCRKPVPTYRDKICLKCLRPFTCYNGDDYCGSCSFFALQIHRKKTKI